MEKARYIALEGPIGVGKTSLSQLLAEEFKGMALLEEVDNNPFLISFYKDRQKYAFQTQLFFLLSRYKQQKELGQQELFNSTIVADYLFAKDKIFAYLNLDENELALYEQIYRLLDARIPKPDLVIYIQARTETLIERIKKRNKVYEKDIEEDYIERLVDAYNRYFFYYTDTPLLVVDTSDIDFVNSRDDLTNVVNEIRSIKGGVQHYVPVR
ncbi:MAG: deoxynucleoside kinase [Deltaproteobacteria bacterium]